jgi:hypothetical protein
VSIQTADAPGNVIGIVVVRALAEEVAGIEAAFLRAAIFKIREPIAKPSIKTRRVGSNSPGREAGASRGKRDRVRNGRRFRGKMRVLLNVPHLSKAQA